MPPRGEIAAQTRLTGQPTPWPIPQIQAWRASNRTTEHRGVPYGAYTYNRAGCVPLRGGPNQEPIIVRLADPASGQLAAGVEPSVTRQLVLFEAEGPTGQPLEDLINNTKWRGIRNRAGNPPDVPVPGSKPDQFGQGLWMRWMWIG